MSAKNDIIHNLTIRLPGNFSQFFEAERKTFEDLNGGINHVSRNFLGSLGLRPETLLRFQ